MARPVFYPEGNASRIKDSRYRRFMKALGAARDQGLGTAANDPRRGDSFAIVTLKLLRTLRGE